MNRPPSSRSPLNHAPVAVPESAPAPAAAGPDLLLMEGSLFWDRYKLPIVAGVLLLVLAIVGSEIYEIDRDKKMHAASAQLDTAKTPADYRHVIETYPATAAAANAALLLGRQQFDSKDYSGAAVTWRGFADQNPQQALAPVALIGAGNALEAVGKNDEARSLFQRAATSHQGSFAAPLARLEEAALLRAENRPEDARRVYENLMASNANTDAARYAAQELQYLRVVPGAPGSTLLPGAVPTPAPAPAASPAAAAPPGAPAAPQASTAPAALVAPARPVSSPTAATAPSPASR